MQEKNNFWVPLLIIFLIILDIFVWRTIFFSAPNNNLEAYFLNVGQGDAEMVILSKGVKILIDGGPDKSILRELSSVLSPFDRYIDLIILSHAQTDHFTGLIDVLKRYQVGAFIYNGQDGTAKSWQELLKTLSANKIPIIVLSEGDKINYLESDLKIISPGQKFLFSNDFNQTTLVGLLDSQGVRILFTGDIDAEVEEYLAQKYNLDIDVLKVAHHGSKYSSSEKFLQAVKPKMAVIEVGKNSYGHPTVNALNRLAAVGAQIFRTDKDGLVKLVIGNRQIDIFKKNILQATNLAR